MSAAVRYRISPADPREHYFDVELLLQTPDPSGQRFVMPSWIRGSYLVRDFAKHVQELQVDCAGEAVTFTRLDKRSIQCAPCVGPLRLRYRVYAYDESVRKAWLDLQRGFFNASSLCYCPEGAANAAMELELLPPTDPLCSEWKVATTLPAVQVDARGFGLYRAEDYEALIDHPVELGRFTRIDFTADGIPHALVLSGRHVVDAERVVRDLTRICETQRALFAQQPALQQYLFLTAVTGSGYGGLEHRSSTALICARKDLPNPSEPRLTKEYRTFLGLCSHEYFHLWNVKRITPQRFQESDLAREAYTEDLWHYEGVTSYYDDLTLLRAGVLDAPAYLDVLAENATRLQRTPGRNRQSLADASFESWIKYYQPDENTPNASVSYYIKGALVAMCLDLTLRLHSTVTLDDVMRGLWQRYGAQGRGVPERGLEQLAQELSGLDLREFFDRALRSTEELPLAELLAAFGVEARLRAQVNDQDLGGRTAQEAPRAWIGLKLKPGEARVGFVTNGSPAAKAGISVNDTLVALDGLRITPAAWSSQVAQLTPGRALRLHLFHGDELLETQLEPCVPPLDTWTFSLAEVSDEVLQRRRAWLGS